MNTEITTETDQQVQISYKPQSVVALPAFALPANATPQERMEMAKIVSKFLGSSTSMEEAVNTTVQIVGCLVHPVQMTDTQTGEVIERDRIVWLLEDGSCLSSTSFVTLRFTQMVLLPFFGGKGQVGLLEFPAHVKIKSQKTRANRKTYDFELVTSL